MESIVVRTMRESDLGAARRIFSIAFGTFLGLPDPAIFAADRDFIGTRWLAAPDSSLVADKDGLLVGSNQVTRWGSFGFFGPLTIGPELWNQGIAQKLLSSTMDLFDSWGIREAGLYTFANSARHVGLYQKFGFWPRFLTALMSKPVGEPRNVTFTKYSALTPDQRTEAVGACRELTHSIFDGLDVTREILAIERQNLGDTVLIWGGDQLEAFAVCHCGAGTEAGTGNCYIKFAAARAGSNAGKSFEHLLDACHSFAAERGLARLEAGVNLGRGAAYRSMLAFGFRSSTQGVAMHLRDSPGFSRPDVFAIDDWR